MQLLDKRQILLNSAVKVVANVGLENATTNAICRQAGLNEVYIYRNFSDKDHLILESYLKENKKFMILIIDEIEEQNKHIESRSLEERSKAVIHKGWEYLTSNAEICKFLVYYYQSSQFTRHALDEHNYWAEELLGKLNLTYYNSKESARAMLYIIFNSVYAMAKQVADKRLPNTKETEEMVFKSVFVTISACYGGA